ncbi:uncharacterized protein LOC124533006 [Vanessa cardui]|uniref:uncharacterized protein LOC124533006 n=1 Tax=Vanessa cardui TaxID=171605 RepID=UPI001F12E9A0|nr:uncharacterized protein LOC124533006 [Vanessa cardui]
MVTVLNVISNSSSNLDFTESNSFGRDGITLPLKIAKAIVPLNVSAINDTKDNNHFFKNVKDFPTTAKYLTNLKTLKEYDYKNDYEEDVYQMLRLQSSSDTVNTKSEKYMYNNDTPNGRFFNLEPAVDFENSLKISKNIADNNVWYVPQEFPCWELPILYGELGTKKKKSDVFLIYGGNLINVIDPWTTVQSKFKASDPLMSHSINKWCEVEPCYGDHTLCLFSNNGISNICDKNFKVLVPSILDQLTIISTINAMRNRVANGLAKRYTHLPTAANMKQITYDYDLEKMAEAWLSQCLPGAAPCSALDGNIVSQLECTKYMKYCCLRVSKTMSQCTPRAECFIYPIVGCLHIWFSSAGDKLIETDIHCGRTTVKTFNTVQLLWAKTSKIGCAYGERSNGDVRIVCNFSPGAPFYLQTKLFCGLIEHNDIEFLRDNENITSSAFLSSLGIKWNSVLKKTRTNNSLNSVLDLKEESLHATTKSKSVWGVDSLAKIYEQGWVRKKLDNYENGTRGVIARLVARYKFIDESESRCDSDESIYKIGSPGSMCVERSRTFHALCYDFRDPTTGYRLIAIAAPIVLFSLILYDLFSGVVRQTIY